VALYHDKVPDFHDKVPDLNSCLAHCPANMPKREKVAIRVGSARREFNLGKLS
jgi:hypothetical protein